MTGSEETVVLGGGCFWCLEAVFQRLKGVREVESGYAGGRDPRPTYRSVCSGKTGHAEVVKVDFDPAAISLRDLLRVFFTIHDPTTPDRQGADVGPQYRSVIFFCTPEQKQTIDAVIRELESSGVWPDPVVTEVAPLQTFYPAEDEHHDYYRRNSGQPYCRLVIAPKLVKARTEGNDLLFRD